MRRANKSHHHIPSRTHLMIKILAMKVNKVAGMVSYFNCLFSYETVKSRGKKRIAKYKDESSDGEDSDFS